MKKSIKRISTLALSTLMAVSAIGGVTASAAETNSNSDSNIKTYYFISNKGWNDVRVYLWDDPDTKGEPIKKNAEFPGRAMTFAGTTTALDGKTSQDVYTITVDTNEYDAMVISSPNTDGQQTKRDIYFKDTKSNCFFLDGNNFPVEKENFSMNDIDTTVKRFYFVNTKDWQHVYAYTKDKVDENGVTKTEVKERKNAFPGTEEVKIMGSTTVIDGSAHDVYAVDVHEDDDEIVFTDGINTTKVSVADIRYKWGGANVISIDSDGSALVGHFFDSALNSLSHRK